MSEYSKEAAEEMHAALLDIMARWSDGQGSNYDAGEFMYQRAAEALRKSSALSCPDCGGKGATAPNGVTYCNCDDGDRAAANGEGSR